MTDQNNEHEPQGTSRRDFIKKSAITTGAVWAAPTVLSVGPSAFATTGSPITPGLDCQGMLYRFKWNASGDSAPANFEGPLQDGNQNFRNGCGAPDGWDNAISLQQGADGDYNVVVNGTGETLGTVTATENPDGSVTFQLPESCFATNVSAKAGSGDGSCSEQVSPTEGGSFTVSMTSGKAVSDAGVVFCCVDR